MRNTRVEGAVVIIKARSRSTCTRHARTGDLQDATLARRPRRVLLSAALPFDAAQLGPATGRARPRELRGREFFNEPALFIEATSEALEAKLSLMTPAAPSTWASVVGLDEAVAAQQCRGGAACVGGACRHRRPSVGPSGEALPSAKRNPRGV